MRRGLEAGCGFDNKHGPHLWRNRYTGPRVDGAASNATATDRAKQDGGETLTSSFERPHPNRLTLAMCIS